MITFVRRWARRRWPEGPEYVAPSDWWPLISVCAVLVGGATGGLAWLFTVFGVLTGVVYVARWVRHRKGRNGRSR